jgi:transmembrane sensor
MPDIFYRTLIIKEIKGEASVVESENVSQWINQSSENQKIYHELWSAYALTSPDVYPFIADREAAWSKIIHHIAILRPHGPRVIQFLRVAAAAVIFFLVGIAVQYSKREKIPPDFLNQFTTVTAPVGQKSMIVLPDRSNVWLNSGSSLKYKSSFNTEIRDVELDGEAFFEVTQDKSRMFRVNTGAVSIEVYGTDFDVKNYKEEKELEVTVEKGNVGVIKGGLKFADLTKGKQVTLNKENEEVILSNPKVDVVTAWKNNELIFDNTPFEEVIRYLERWYGVNITIEEKMKKRHNYTFKIKTETLTELLKLLKVITPLEYKIDGKDVTIRYAI